MQKIFMVLKIHLNFSLLYQFWEIPSLYNYSLRSPSSASVFWGSGWTHRAWCTLGTGCGGSCRTGVLIYPAGSRRCKRPVPLPLSDDLNPLARAWGISMQSVWWFSACNIWFSAFLGSHCWFVYVKLLYVWMSHPCSKYRGPTHSMFPPPPPAVWSHTEALGTTRYDRSGGKESGASHGDGSSDDQRQTSHL